MRALSREVHEDVLRWQLALMVSAAGAQVLARPPGRAIGSAWPRRPELVRHSELRPVERDRAGLRLLRLKSITAQSPPAGV